MLKTYRLPSRFVWDHWSRDLPETGHSERVRETSKNVFVEMDEAGYDDLLSDARYYSSVATTAVLDASLRGLARSAAATIAALEAQGRP